MRDQEKDDLTLLVLDGNDIQQTAERLSCNFISWDYTEFNEWTNERTNKRTNERTATITTLRMIIEYINWIMLNQYIKFSCNLNSLYQLSTEFFTSFSGAPVAPHHATSRHADRHYGKSRNMKYSNFRDPEGHCQGHYFHFTKSIVLFIGQCHP